MEWSPILVGIIAACGGIIVAIINACANAHKMRSELREGMLGVRAEISTEMAVVNTKLEELTRETREHNEFGRRIPVIEEQIKVANNRIHDLEIKVG